MIGPKATMLDRALSPLRLVFGFALTAGLACVVIPIAIVLLPSRPMRVKLCNYYGKVLGRALVAIAGVRTAVHNRKHLAGPGIFVSNHTSVTDVFMAIQLCPVGGCGVAKREIARIPFFGWLYLLSGHLLIDRADRAGAIAALERTAEVVKRHNLSIWIWPEGTRSPDGRLMPLKKGFAHLAIATGLPIVPVVLHRAYESWPKHSMVLRPMTLRVDVLEPIPTTGWKAETLEAHVAEVHAAFARALGPEQKPREQPRPASLDNAA